MKIGYASDIHDELEGQRQLELSEPVDVLILAGDIGKGAKAIHYGSQFLGHAKAIVQVAGNHEHWRDETTATLRKMREAAAEYDNLHFLENDSVEIDGMWFHGSTAWTDYTYGDDNQSLHMMDAASIMNDYKKIKFIERGAYRKLKPRDCLVMNHAAREFLFNAVEEKGRENSIVVTHHAPCHLSIPEKFKCDKQNHSYVNRWGDHIAHNGPRLWFHGHIHSPSDYEVGDTRVLCNPIGYPGEQPGTSIQILEI